MMILSLFLFALESRVHTGCGCAGSRDLPGLLLAEWDVSLGGLGVEATAAKIAQG